MRELAIRGLALYLPMLAVGLAWLVRRPTPGPPYIIRVTTAVCSANSDTVEVCSTTSCAIA